MKHIFRDKKYVWSILIAAAFIIGVAYISPIAFAKDGLLTRMKVDSYEAQYNLGATRRHDGEEKGIYLFYLGLKDIRVETESKGTESDKGQYAEAGVEAKRVLPFLYKWEWRGEPVYRVSIGEDKYYFTIVVT